MFYTFHQNNSGGSFVEDERSGITSAVIVEADNSDEANNLAQRIGVYFDEDYSVDCECCGTRWSAAWEDEGRKVPSIYEQDVSGGTYSTKWSRWTDLAAYIHYKDGRVVPVEWAKEETR